MLTPLRSTICVLALAGAAAFFAGCGDSGPDPSISNEEASVLLSKIEEVQNNVDAQSCVVAARVTDDLIADIQDLPSSVNSDVKLALNNGANNLKQLVSDPTKCESKTTTTETTTAESTTEPTTTRRPTTTTPTQTQAPPTTTVAPPTQTTTPTTPGGSGGIGPG